MEDNTMGKESCSALGRLPGCLQHFPSSPFRSYSAEGSSPEPTTSTDIRPRASRDVANGEQ